MTIGASRRQALTEFGAALGVAIAFRTPLAMATTGKQLRGIFPVMATPYTATGEVDYEDLAGEVSFLDRCGVHGLVWPQKASGYRALKKEERMRGMEVVAKAAKGKRPALVLGVQAANTEQMLEFARRAEQLEPDAVMAMPPYEAKSLEQYREYFGSLAKFTKRPVFIQTTGGAPGLDPPVQFLIELTREFPNLGYIKEEANPTIDRMKALIAAKPVIKRVFSGYDGMGMMFEMRFGSDGTMPSAAFSDVEATVWELYHSGQKAKAREAFASLTLMVNAIVPFRKETQNIGEFYFGMTQYFMKKRGVFKSGAIRAQNGQLYEIALGSDELQEIDYCYAAIQPFLRV